MRFRTVSLTAKIIFIERRMVLGILENWIPEEKIAHNVTQDVYEIVSVVVVTTVVCTHSFYPSTKMFNVCSMYHMFDIRIWRQKYFDHHIVRNHSVPVVGINRFSKNYLIYQFASRQKIYSIFIITICKIDLWTVINYTCK